MSYSNYSNSFRNIYGINNSQINKKNTSTSPPSSSQLNSAGRIASTPINYHYLHKDREKEKEREKDIQIKNQSKTPNDLITNSFISNYRQTNINSYRNNENNKYNNDIFNSNNINNNYYQNNNYLRRNYHQNNYLNRNNQDNKEIKLQSNIQNQMENEKSQKAKSLMDDFDKKLYDTTTNFGPKHMFNKDEKAKDIENEKEIQRKPTPNSYSNSNFNYNDNYRKRNFSYDKYNLNKANNNYNNNYGNNYENKYPQNYHNQNSTLRNTDSLYKNYFENNANIHPKSPNENNNNYENNRNNINNYHNYNNYSNYNNGKDNYRNQKNSVDKVMLNKYQPYNIYNRNANPDTRNYRNINDVNTKKINYIVKNFSSYSMGGTDGFRHPKTNQDSCLTKKDLTNYIFGVFDGHGFEGHLVSQSIKNYLNNNANSSTFSIDENIYSLFKNLSSSINSSLSFNGMESGSTVVMTFVSNDKIICANCGDSRAILISEDENKIIALSRDHKPELPDEKKRILESGGRVDKIYGMGPFRVWFKDADYPGLAMSRSIGDGYAHKVGVSDIPEIKEFEVDKVKPRAIILASDGVFEFVKNEEIKDIVGKYFYSMDSQGCAKEIVEYSRKVWENSGYAIDDITCVVAFFEQSK